jgi:universal stress protein A
MSNARMDYRQLLVAVDLGEGDATEHVVRRGLELGRRLGAAVDAANILEKAPGYLKHTLSREDLSATDSKSRRWSQERLEDLKGRYPGLQGTHTARGASADQIRGLVKEIRADLLVVGAHERRGIAVLFGDRSDELLHRAPCDVLVVKDQAVDAPPDSPKPYRHILAGVDPPADGSALVVERAAGLAEVYEAKLTLIHVIDHFPVDRSNAMIAPEDQDPLAYEQEQSRRRLREVAAEAGAGDSDIQVIATSTTASREIPELAKVNGIDLIVTGSHGRHGLGRIIGSTADGLRHRSQCDVLVVRIVCDD